MKPKFVEVWFPSVQALGVVKRNTWSNVFSKTETITNKSKQARGRMFSKVPNLFLKGRVLKAL